MAYTFGAYSIYHKNANVRIQVARRESMWPEIQQTFSYWRIPWRIPTLCQGLCFVPWALDHFLCLRIPRTWMEN